MTQIYSLINKIDDYHIAGDNIWMEGYCYPPPLDEDRLGITVNDVYGNKIRVDPDNLKLESCFSDYLHVEVYIDEISGRRRLRMAVGS